MSITINISPELESRLKQIAAEQGIAVDAYITRVIEQLAKPGQAPISKEERELDLLQQINQLGLSEEGWERYNYLKKQAEEEALTEAEHQEIIETSRNLEAMNVERIKLLIELADIQGKSLDEIIIDLGIRGDTI